MPSPLPLLRGFVFALLAVTSVAFLSPYAIVLTLPLMFSTSSYGLYRWWHDNLANSWFTFMAVLIEKVMGTRLVVTGDSLNQYKNDRALVISNHRTRLDWMFLWSFFLREGRLQNLKIVMKSMLKKLLPFGWPMQSAAFIFLNRKWEEDKEYLQDYMEFLHQQDYPAQVLLFPEGTDKTANTTKRSDAFAEKEGLAKLSNVLQPRVTGFSYFLQQMRNDPKFSAVYDVTISYHPFPPQNESSIFTGFPSEFRAHIERFDQKDLPETEEGVAEWLRTRWTLKDERLGRELSSSSSSPLLPQERESANSDETVVSGQLFHILLWLFVTILSLNLFITSSVAFYFTLVSWVALQSLTIYSPIDLWEIALNFHEKEE
eukprot:TRINITY_DN7677_c0_g1_i1.p1 TRINITY_DN7677_c0_g1~~TRINITY_DN7677_c0_g1_i1.p1  ORF type:complete len:373 (-),score=71.49 TRINITY_DN7677_c0_g1_i1:97-1215(-)